MAAGASLLAALLLASCSATPQTTAPTAPAPASSTAAGSDPDPAVSPQASRETVTAAVAWTNTHSVPLSDVTSVAGQALVVAGVDRRLEVQSLNLATGEVVWAHRVTASLVSPQQPIDVTALANRYVAVLEPLSGGGQRARLQLLDVTQKGRIVGGSGTYQFTSFPETCPDDSSSVCARAVRGTTAVEVRLRPGSPAREVRLADSGDSYQDLASSGLVRFLDPATRTVTIGVEQGGKLRWKKSEKELFGKLSTDGGWYFRREGDVIHGSVGLARPRSTDQLPVRYLGVGLDARTGKRLWSLPGADLGCASTTEVVLACRWQAGRVLPSGLLDGGRMVLQRLDPTTGKALWTTRPLFVTGRIAARLGQAGDGVVVEETDGRIVVDVTTGVTRRATAVDATWSTVLVDVPSAEPWYHGSTRMDTRRGAVNQVSGSRPEAFHLPIPQAVGAQFGRLRVLSLPGRIVALDTQG
ncbi:hypothetical protein [Luteococcus peritonei]|uniref:PQQ-binding-like beta-propeller repeat protein n=1 Tax=Luteococcus peritonei TaxID=88874 RepID=A0ABW4RUW6_9ACTN